MPCRGPRRGIGAINVLPIRPSRKSDRPGTATAGVGKKRFRRAPASSWYPAFIDVGEMSPAAAQAPGLACQNTPWPARPHPHAGTPRHTAVSRCCIVAARIRRAAWSGPGRYRHAKDAGFVVCAYYRGDRRPHSEGMPGRSAVHRPNIAMPGASSYGDSQAFDLFSEFSRSSRGMYHSHNPAGSPAKRDRDSMFKSESPIAPGRGLHGHWSLDQVVRRLVRRCLWTPVKSRTRVAARGALRTAARR